MKVENLKKALKLRTSVSYELLKERFDYKYTKIYNSFEDLVNDSNFAHTIIGCLCNWSKTPERYDFWKKVTYSLVGLNDEKVESEFFVFW